MSESDSSNNDSSSETEHNIEEPIKTVDATEHAKDSQDSATEHDKYPSATEHVIPSATEHGGDGVLPKKRSLVDEEKENMKEHGLKLYLKRLFITGRYQKRWQNMPKNILKSLSVTKN